jgi:hypothetical protein
MLFSKEHYDLMAQFDKLFKHFRLDKENRSEWSRGCIYQNGEVNELFKAFRQGYMLGKQDA